MLDITGGAIVWGGDVDVVSVNGVVTRGSSCGVPETCNKVEGKKAEGRFVADVGGKKSTSGSGDTNAPDLLG